MAAAVKALPIGQKFVSEGRTISEGEFTQFHNMTWILDPMHCDKEAMKSTPFGERILAGPVVLCILLGLSKSTGILEAITDTGRNLVAMLGIENVTFQAPVLPGDTLKIEREITSSRPTKNPKREVISIKDTGRKQTGDIVLAATTNWLYEQTG